MVLSQAASRTRRVFYTRRNEAIDSIDPSTLTYNPYRNRYQTKFKPIMQQSNTQISYNKHLTTDDEWIGDKMTPKPKDTCTRFWLQNARGILSSFDGNLFRYDLTNIQNNNIHYYALPEYKINTSNSDVTNHLMQIHQNIFGSGMLTITNSPSFPINTNNNLEVSLLVSSDVLRTDIQKHNETHSAAGIITSSLAVTTSYVYTHYTG